MSNDKQFEWDDKAFDDFRLFVEYKSGEHNIPNPSMKMIYQWKYEFVKSKEVQELPERIEVDFIETNAPRTKDLYSHSFTTNQPLNDYKKIRESIEKALNDEDTVVEGKKYFDTGSSIEYTDNSTKPVERYPLDLSNDETTAIFDMAKAYLNQINCTYAYTIEQRLKLIQSARFLDIRVRADGREYLFEGDFIKSLTYKTHTQKEVDAIRERTFGDGYFKGWYNGCFEKDKTMSRQVTEKAYSEYLQSLNKPTTESLSTNKPILFTKHELLEAEQKAFYAGGDVDWDKGKGYPRYKTFTDYKEQTKKTKTVTEDNNQMDFQALINVLVPILDEWSIVEYKMRQMQSKQFSVPEDLINLKKSLINQVEDLVMKHNEPTLKKIITN